MADVRGLASRVKKLERTRGASADMQAWFTQAFDAALAEERICPMDGPVIKHCLLKWIEEGTPRSGGAGWALPN